MTQLIVSLEDKSILAEIKNAIKMLRGVVAVDEATDLPNQTTLDAMREAESGCVVVCENMEEYLKAVKDV